MHSYTESIIVHEAVHYKQYVEKRLTAKTKNARSVKSYYKNKFEKEAHMWQLRYLATQGYDLDKFLDAFYEMDLTTLRDSKPSTYKAHMTALKKQDSGKFFIWLWGAAFSRGVQPLSASRLLS